MVDDLSLQDISIVHACDMHVWVPVTCISHAPLTTYCNYGEDLKYGCFIATCYVVSAGHTGRSWPQEKRRTKRRVPPVGKVPNHVIINSSSVVVCNSPHMVMCEVMCVSRVIMIT